MTRPALAIDISTWSIQGDVDGAGDRYGAHIVGRIFRLSRACPAIVPPGLGNWFFGRVVEMAVWAVYTGWPAEDRERLKWTVALEPTRGQHFTINATRI